MSPPSPDYPASRPAGLTPVTTRLPPSPTPPAQRSPTRPPTRTIYFGIKRGRRPGVYTCSGQAEDQVINYPDACLRCFSTRHAALAYVRGWDCKGRYALPKGSPYPLYEYLPINFSTPPHLLSPPRKARAAYQHPRPIPVRMDEFGSLSPGTDAHPSLAGTSDAITHRASSSTLRPPMARNRDSWRSSMVKSPSPLRHQVDEPATKPWAENVRNVVEAGLTRIPLASPDKTALRDEGQGTVSGKDKAKRSSIFGFPTFSRKQSAPAGKLLSSPEITSSPRDLAPPPPRQPLRSTRSSPNLPRGSPMTQHAPSRLNPNRQSGLWSSPTSPLAGPSQSRNSFQAPPPKPAPAFANTDAPTFSRAAIRKAGIVMPAPASSAPRKSPSIPSLSPSSSSSSISTISSISSSSNGSRSSVQYAKPMSDFAPPRAGFMRRPSSLSLSMSSPSSSSESLATITSASHSEEEFGAYSERGYAPDALGISVKVEGGQGKKEKKAGGMKGFGRMFGMKKKA